MGDCNLCGEQIPRAESLPAEAEAIVEHLRVFHPEEYGDGPDRWPDGSVVLIDKTLDPDDFTGDDTTEAGT
jgi:hypothetical protein